jgi:hypothetical protein
MERILLYKSKPDVSKIDFLNIKTIVFYLLIFGVLLVSGKYLKDLIPLFIGSLIILNCLTKRFYRSVELFFIWFIVYGFFTSQGYITSTLISKYIAKPSFLLFAIFVFSLEGIRKSAFDKKYLIIWLLYLVIVFFGSAIQSQSFFVVITQSSFILIYFLIQEKQLTEKQYQNLLNFFVAAAVLQTAVSILQIVEIIPPATKMMADGHGNFFLWDAGLNDAASGTFGAGTSHLASWYAGLITLLLLIIWIITKNGYYLIFTISSFAQCATVDSKTIMGVIALMIGYLIFFIFKRKNKFQMNFQKMIVFFITISFIVFAFIKTWDIYYRYYGEKTGSKKIASIDTVYENQMKESVILVMKNITYWGKIRGFEYVFNDFIDSDIKRLIWGYGI